MKLLDPRIGIYVTPESVTIEIHDSNASIRFIEVKLTPEQFTRCLSRQAFVPCEATVTGLEKLNKNMENKNFDFEIPKELASSSNSKELHEIAKKLCPEGWVPDSYFASQGTFFVKDGVQYARCTIRTWKDIAIG